MPKTSTLILCSAITLSFASFANASIQFFDNRADFDIATTGGTLQTELNPGIGASGTSFTTPLGIDVSVTAGLDPNLRLDSTGDATNNLEFSTQTGGVSITFTFVPDISVFGIEIFDAGTTGGTDITIETTLGSQLVFDDFTGGFNNEIFAGVVSTSDTFASVTFSNSDAGDVIRLDDIVFGTVALDTSAVPEPGTIIVWAGLACCGTLATKRRRH